MEGLKDLDYTLFRSINAGLGQGWLVPVFWVITSTGLGWVQLLFSATVLRSREWRAFFFMTLLNVLVVGNLATLAKKVIPRDRPSKLIDSIVAVDERIYGNSFPSGHATVSFAFATCMFLLSKKLSRPIYGYFAILWALLVGISRIYRGLHWPSDVLAGAFLGIAGGILSFLLVDRFTSIESMPNAQSDELATAASQE